MGGWFLQCHPFLVDVSVLKSETKVAVIVGVLQCYLTPHVCLLLQWRLTVASVSSIKKGYMNIEHA